MGQVQVNTSADPLALLSGQAKLAVSNHGVRAYVELAVLPALFLDSNNDLEKRRL